MGGGAIRSRIRKEVEEEKRARSERVNLFANSLKGRTVADLRELLEHWEGVRKLNRKLDDDSIKLRLEAEDCIEAIKRSLSPVPMISAPELESNRTTGGNPSNMSVAEAARYLCISTSTLYKMTSRNEIPFHKIGKRRLSFNQIELDAYVKSQRNTTNEEVDEQASQILSRRRATKK
jgi:excisionase family DNA binding protein